MRERCRNGAADTDVRVGRDRDERVHYRSNSLGSKSFSRVEQSFKMTDIYEETTDKLLAPRERGLRYTCYAEHMHVTNDGIVLIC